MRIVYRDTQKNRVVRFREIPSGDTFRLERGHKVMMATAIWVNEPYRGQRSCRQITRNAVYLESGHMSFVDDNAVVVPVDAQLEVL